MHKSSCHTILWRYFIEIMWSKQLNYLLKYGLIIRKYLSSKYLDINSVAFLIKTSLNSEKKEDNYDLTFWIANDMLHHFEVVSFSMYSQTQFKLYQSTQSLKKLKYI